MQLLTPTGYRDVSTLAPGDEACAFEGGTGAAITNRIQSIAWIDAGTFESWQNPRFLINGTLTLFGLHTYYSLRAPESGPVLRTAKQLAVGDTITMHDGSQVPISSLVQTDATEAWTFFLINGTYTLNSHQSIWRNGSDVCHVTDLVVGDTIYDDADNPVTITSIAETTADGWYRFDIDGDHSYIADGLTLHNASRFWVGGTGTWDLVTTTHWASTTGGAGGASAPTSADAVTIDASSGAGTITPSLGGSASFQSITSGAMGMTLDFSANSDSVTLSSWSNTGSGTRTISLGSGTFTITSNSGTPWTWTTATNLTFNANSSTLAFTGVGAASRLFSGGSLAYNIVSIPANASGGLFSFSGAGTIATLNVTAPNAISVSTGGMTVTNPLSLSGISLSQPILIETGTPGSTATITSASNGTFAYCAFRDVAFAGGGTFAATNSIDLGHNSGITITAPAGGAIVTVRRGATVRAAHLIRRRPVVIPAASVPIPAPPRRVVATRYVQVRRPASPGPSPIQPVLPVKRTVR